PWQGAQPVHGSADTSYRRIGDKGDKVRYLDTSGPRPWQGAQPVHGSADTSYRRIGEGHEPRFRLIWTPVLWEGDLALDSRQSPLGNADYVRGDALESISAGCRRTFLRFIFCANLLLSRFFSPGFRKKECLFTSLIMPSC